MDRALIHAQLIDQFSEGRMRVMAASDSGTVTLSNKEGPVEVPYPAGSILLVNERDEVVCGPTSFEGALDLAERALDGHSRTITDSIALLAIASAFIGYAGRLEPAPEPAAQALQEVVS